MFNINAFKPQILKAFHNKLSAKIPSQIKIKASTGLGRWQLLQQMNSYESIPQMFFKIAENMKDIPMLWRWKDDNFHPITWTQVEKQVLDFASGLKNLGVKKGDRIIIVGENRPEWCISDLAINSIGAITVSAYVTNTAHDHAYLLQDSGARLAIVSNKKLAGNIIMAFRQEQLLGQLIVMDDAQTVESTGAVNVKSFATVCDDGAANPSVTAQQAADICDRKDVSCLIYTSGTTSDPKGAMLTHGNLIHNSAQTRKMLKDINYNGPGKERFLSILPLSHAYEHTLGHIMPIIIGAQIYYAPGLDKLIHYISVSRPTLVLCVPRLYDAMKQKITQQLTLGSPLVRRIFERTIDLGKKRYYNQQTFRDMIENKLLDWSVRRSFRKRFGGQLKAFVSGGAPLNIESGLFFNALGAVIFQGYGQTEAAPLITLTDGISNVRLHTVGPSTPDVEVKIGDDGEVLTRSESIMKGYWNKPDLNPVDADGWLHTGDVGYLDDKNNLIITDRIKDMIVNSGGDNISPVKVESVMSAEPEIGQIVVYGDKHPHLVAVVVPNDNFISMWNKKNGTEITSKTLAGEEAFLRSVMEGVNRANTKLSMVEQVKKIILADQPFSIENGMITPSLKIKRPMIRAVYGERLEALYKNRI